MLWVLRRFSRLEKRVGVNYKQTEKVGSVLTKCVQFFLHWFKAMGAGILAPYNRMRTVPNGPAPRHSLRYHAVLQSVPGPCDVTDAAAAGKPRGEGTCNTRAFCAPPTSIMSHRRYMNRVICFPSLYAHVTSRL